MAKQQTIAGSGYKPIQSMQNAQPPSLVWQAVVFMCVFAVLQASWLAVRDDSIGHFVRGDITVKPVVAVINMLSPQIGAVASGNQIQAQGGGIVIKLGCEGVEVLLLLIAAFVSAGIKWRSKLEGVLLGAVFIYLINQTRILALFFAFRMNKPFFYFLHGTLTPIILVGLAGLFFHVWLVKYGR